MSDVVAGQSSLDGLLEPSVHSSAGNEPGVTIQERRNVAQLQLIARNNKTTNLAISLSGFLGRKSMPARMEGAERQGLFICATGPQEYWILVEDDSASETIRDLEETVGDSASVFVQGDGRFVIRLAGKNAVNVLAKGTSLDLHRQSFPALGAIHTLIEQFPALVAWRTDPTCYDVSVPRSYAASFITWLREAAREYGYVIK